jgi:hypothetical protein
MARELDRRVADGAGATGDEDCLAVDRPVGGEAAVRGHRRNAETGAEVERQVVRERHGLLRRQRDPLRRAALRPLPLSLPQPHALAHARAVHALADRLDHSGAVLVRDHGVEVRGGAPTALARLPVGWIHARDVHAHEHLARARLGLVEPGDLELAGVVAGGAVLGGQHGRRG